MAEKNNIILSIPQDCDNAPKRRIIRDFIVAIYKKEWEEINEVLEEKFEYKIISNKTIKVKEDLIRYLDKDITIIELKIDEVLSHGKLGACNGVLKSKKGEINFAYFFEFISAGKNSIKTISEYLIY